MMFCAICTVDISERHPNARYCSRKCSSQADRIKNGEKKRERDRLYRENNREKFLAGMRRWYVENRARVLEYHRDLYKSDPEKYKANNRAWMAANPDRVKANNKAWANANPEKRRKIGQKYAAANAEQIKVNTRRYRAKKRDAFGSHTLAEWQAIVKRQKSVCAHFGTDLAAPNCKSHGGKKCELTADHIWPLDGGGSDFAYNIQGLCGSCNASKRDRIVDYAHPSLFNRPAA